jgi:hypothetical protein
MVREGTAKVNGYDAIRYSIDTARSSAAESALYRSTLGPGGFERGTVWVTSPGCPVKFSLDSEMHLNDGSVQKVALGRHTTALFAFENQKYNS